MFKFDLKAGYHHVDIAEWCRTFLGFKWMGKYYVFTVLPFGLSSAPYIFTKCLRPMVKYWRENGINIVLYLDDGWCVNRNYQSSIQDSVFVFDSLNRAGFVVNDDKSVKQPVTCLTWLGLIWNSACHALYIPDQRVQELTLCINKILSNMCNVSARLLARATGRIISMSPVIGNVARIKTRHLYRCIESRSGWDYLFKLTDQYVIDELLFWRSNIINLNYRNLSDYSVPSVICYSDASRYACGVVTTKGDLSVFHKMWSADEIDTSSTWRELKSIELYVCTYQDQLQGKAVKCFTDSKNCERIVEVGSTKSDLQELAMSIFSVCRSRSISMDVQWLPRDLNYEADIVSKIYDFDDWGVTKEFFSFVDSLFGPHTVDRFADSNNSKLPRFNSRFATLGSDGVDAFSIDWKGHNNWLVPPINLVGKAIQHCLACNAVATLVIPKWPSSSFWPFIFRNAYNTYTYILDVLEFDNPDGIFIQGSNYQSIFGSNAFSSSVLVVRIDGQYKG